jgi:hypothetical protein
MVLVAWNLKGFNSDRPRRSRGPIVHGAGGHRRSRACRQAPDDSGAHAARAPGHDDSSSAAVHRVTAAVPGGKGGRHVTIRTGHEPRTPAEKCSLPIRRGWWSPAPGELLFADSANVGVLEAACEFEAVAHESPSQRHKVRREAIKKGLVLEDKRQPPSAATGRGLRLGIVWPSSSKVSAVSAHGMPFARESSLHSSQKGMVTSAQPGMLRSASSSPSSSYAPPPADPLRPGGRRQAADRRRVRQAKPG